MLTQLIIPGRQATIAVVGVSVKTSPSPIVIAAGTIGGCPSMPYVALDITMDDELSTRQPVIGRGIKEEHLEEQDGCGTYPYAPKSQVGIDTGEVVGQSSCS